MKPFALALAALLVGTCSLADERCSWKLGNHPFFPLTKAAATRSGFAYEDTVDAALRREPRALQTLLRFTGTIAEDDGIGLVHSETLLIVLQCWGDASFSKALARESKKVRRAVNIWLAQFTEETSLEGTFPLTEKQWPR
jgi:hypothetical protein